MTTATTALVVTVHADNTSLEIQRKYASVETQAIPTRGTRIKDTQTPFHDVMDKGSKVKDSEAPLRAGSKAHVLTRRQWR